jgi:hypothetical protein
MERPRLSSLEFGCGALSARLVGNEVHLVSAGGHRLVGRHPSSLDQKLGALLPQYRHLMSKEVASITLEQLLTVTSGVGEDDTTHERERKSQDYIAEVVRQGINAVEDEADIVVPFSLLRCPHCAAGRAGSLRRISVVYRSAT